MHFQLIVGLIGLSMLSCFNLVAAGPLIYFNGTVSESALNKRTTPAASAPSPWVCSSEQQKVMGEAGQEVVNVLERTVDRTKALLSYLQMTPKPPDSSTMSSELRATGRTFQSIYGAVMNDQNVVNAQGVGRVKDILQKAETILNFLQNPSHQVDEKSSRLQIFCDDSWLSHEDGFKQTKGPFWYWDGKRDYSSNGWEFTANTGGICRDNPKLKGITFPEEVPFLGPKDAWDVITLCQDWMPGWVSGWNSGDTLANYQSTFQGPQVSLDQVVGPIISTTLLHELTHCANVLGGMDQIFVDKSCQNGQTAYEWQCITDLGKQDPYHSVGNADSFMYYASAMYLDKNDWSRGLAMGL